MFDYGQILLHDPRDVRDFPETSPKRQVGDASRGSFKLVPDFIETYLKVGDISESLGQVRNFPRQVSATPRVSPTIKSHSHVTYIGVWQDGRQLKGICCCHQCAFNYMLLVCESVTLLQLYFIAGVVRHSVAYRWRSICDGGKDSVVTIHCYTWTRSRRSQRAVKSPFVVSVANYTTRTCKLVVDFSDTRRRTRRVRSIPRNFPKTSPSCSYFVAHSTTRTCRRFPRDKTETSRRLLSPGSFGEVRVMEFSL